MKIDETEPAVTQATCEEDRQNRREFFNGLGKWSMVVVAAISLLHRSGSAARARHEETSGTEQEPERPAWTLSDDGRNERIKLAKKPYVKNYDKETGGPGGGYAKDHTNVKVPYQRYTKSI
jgi:hypothetical protein